MADDDMGNALDYVYELDGDTLKIWAWERGVPSVLQRHVQRRR